MEYPVVSISIAMQEVLWRAEHHKGLSSRDIISINRAKDFLSTVYETAQELRSGIVRDNPDYYRTFSRASGLAPDVGYTVHMRSIEELQGQLSAVCQMRPTNLRNLTSLFSHLLEDFHRNPR